MKYLKLYEGFFDKMGNVLNKYTKQQIIDIFQELIDDYNVSITIDSCQFSRRKIKGSLGILDTSNNTWWYATNSKKDNAYVLYIKIPSESSDEIIKIYNLMKDKSDLYNFKYVREPIKIWNNTRTSMIYIYI